MNNRKSVETKYGLADSEIVSFKSEDFNLIVYLQAWNGNILKVEFKDCIYFSNYQAGDISDICENPSSPSLQLALDHKYQNIPSDHGYKAYQFLDLDDDPVIEVVSQGIIISKCEDKN
ncbi:MAG: hypothetical protein BGO14_00925 [Chlamydiales bacterium 38-26]|nr:hypothetical protein [Chlamydiales bacterium]OJV07284.1 MAG: hypothetical protein BGO14_00925 [Chlamydiales bacterium 38-26]